MGEKFKGGPMGEKPRFHGDPEDLKKQGVEEALNRLEKTNPDLAEMLKKHLNPPTKKELEEARLHELQLIKGVPEKDL